MSTQLQFIETYSLDIFRDFRSSTIGCQTALQCHMQNICMKTYPSKNVYGWKAPGGSSLLWICHKNSPELKDATK